MCTDRTRVTSQQAEVLLLCSVARRSSPSASIPGVPTVYWLDQQAYRLSATSSDLEVYCVQLYKLET